MSKWVTSHLTVNDKNKSYEYNLGDGASVLQIMETIASADVHHPNATSMVIVLVRRRDE